jgi:hypothetical protein
MHVLKTSLSATSFAVLLAFAPSEAGDVPDKGAKPLAEIVKTLEDRKLGTVTEMEFDDGKWEGKVCKAPDTCLSLKMDALTGVETDRKTEKSKEDAPPAESAALSGILQGMVTNGLGTPIDVEWESEGYWEVEVLAEGKNKKKTLKIDPVTGNVKS